MKPSDVVKNDKTKNFIVVFNILGVGTLEIAIAGSAPIKGTGKLVDVSFEPLNKKTRTTNLHLTEGNMNDQSIVIKSLQANKPTNQVPNTKVKWKSEAVGEGLEYSWVLYEETKGIAKQGYSKLNYFESTLKKAGTYRVLSIVKDKNGEVVSKFSEEIKIVNNK